MSADCRFNIAMRLEQGNTQSSSSAVLMRGIPTMWSTGRCCVTRSFDHMLEKRRWKLKETGARAMCGVELADIPSPEGRAVCVNHSANLEVH